MLTTPDLFIKGCKGKKIVVIGDLVADQFLSGTISRVSREAPVFIMRHEETVTLPGAAANAAANVASLGGEVIAVGVIGNDANGRSLRDAMKLAVIDTSASVEAESPTTTKVRVLAGQQFAAKSQVIRIDYEARDVDGSVHSRIRDNALSAIEVGDAVIVSDYGYGVVTETLFADILAASRRREIPVVVDSRFRLSEFRGASSATPNREEVEQILGSGFTTDQCENLRQELGLEALVVTCGSKGMTVYENNKRAVTLDAVGSSTAVDVTGAGDTVIAAYTLGLAGGLSFVDAARVANHAGGIVVMKKRTATVSAEELASSFNSVDLASHSGTAR